MEKAQIEAARNLEASSKVSHVNNTNTSELPKEKEDELLFGADEDGDEEDALSDDSLRLQLSDDEDVEQENSITNQTKVSEFKSENKGTEHPPVSVEDKIVEDKIYLKSQEIEEVITNSDNGKLPTQGKDKSGSSALPSDEGISENKQKKDNIHNPENSNVTVNESSKKCTFKSDEDLEITEINNSNLNATSKQHGKLENDNSSTNNLSNTQNVEKTAHNEDSVKKEAVDDKLINATNTSAIVPNSDLSDTKIKTATNDKCHPVQQPPVKIDGQNFMGSMKSHVDNSDNLKSAKESTERVKGEIENEKHKNITHNKNSLNTQSTQEETITVLESDQDDLSNVKDEKKTTNKNHNVDKQIVDNITQRINIEKKILFTIDVEEYNDESDTKSDCTTALKTKQLKSNAVQNNSTKEAKSEERESGRHKRRTAKNAEEIIRDYLNSESDASDSTEQIATANRKAAQKAISISKKSSPPPLHIIKRNHSDNEIFNDNVKKRKMTSSTSDEKNVTKLAFIEKFFQRNANEKLPKLTQEELEELLIQKIAETMTMRCEIGYLREQARISEKNQEAMRGKLQQLTKQVKDFEMVLNRNAADRRASSDKPVAPIKINRSVGLQVNFMTDQGIQNLRQIQQTAQLKSANTPSSISPPTSSESSNNNATSPRRSGIKTRSPRTVVTTAVTPTISQSPIQTTPLISPAVTPAALVVAKPLEHPSHTLTLPNQPTSVQPIISAPQQIQPQSHQAIVLNGKIQNQVNRSSTAAKPRNNDLIDLTDEEERNKTTNVKVTSVTTTPLLEQLNVTSKPPVQSFQRVLQTIPTNVAITTQQASIRLITPNQPTPAALVNNINPPRLAYVMQSAGSPRPVLITNTNQQVQIRPVTTCSRPFSTVTYQTAASSIANGTVRVITTPALSNIHMNKHPAPLPDTPSYGITPGWKLPPPAPSLKIAKVSNGKDGIVLSWNMNLSDKYAEIASYQLYAYQEIPGVNPTTTLWKKVGDVRALPLPMACTLTQFSEGNNYYFAVRAVDTHSRKGQYSIPGNISL